jgi:lipopolysaccharide/colanic/teichoic acid biosynthesis glycosyltransferase
MVFKFRSMRLDPEHGSATGWNTKRDPRVTVIGSILRRCRLEGLPQLFNVLRGEMSIVGPQAERPEFVRTLSEQIPYYRQRHAVRPGITGWAQLRYQSSDSFQDTLVKLEYDLYYIKNLSPALDAYCMLQAVKVVLVSIFD